MRFMRLITLLGVCGLLSGCLVTTVVGAATSAVGTAVSTAVGIVDTVTPDIVD